MSRSLRIALVVLAVVATACGGGNEPDTTLPPESEIVLEAAAGAMGSVESVRFMIERSGAPVYIDPLDTLNFASAEGQFSVRDGRAVRPPPAGAEFHKLSTSIEPRCRLPSILYCC